MSSTIGTSISAVRLLKHGYLKGKMKMAIASAVCAMTGSVLGARMSLLVSESVIRQWNLQDLPEIPTGRRSDMLSWSFPLFRIKYVAVPATEFAVASHLNTANSRSHYVIVRHFRVQKCLPTTITKTTHILAQFKCTGNKRQLIFAIKLPSSALSIWTDEPAAFYHSQKISWCDGV